MSHHHRMEMLLTGYLREAETTLCLIVPSALNTLFFNHYYIPSIATLKEERDKITDASARVNIEKLILSEISFLKQYLLDSKQSFLLQEVLQTILKDWIKNKQIERFRLFLLDECMPRNISNENIKLLKILMNFGGFDKDNNAMFALINHAATCGSYQCIRYLLKNSRELDWIPHRKAVCLCNAVKYHSHNTQLIDFILETLEQCKLQFVCDDVMKEVIRFDLVHLARRLIDNRWHTVDEEDELLAQLVDGECHRLFSERARALSYFRTHNVNNEELVDIDDGWDEQQEDDDWHDFSD